MKFDEKSLKIFILIVAFIFVGYYGSKFYIDNRYDYYIVEGESMLPNIQDNQEVKIDKKKKISRYDIVIIDMGNHEIIKRVIGIPGDTIKFTSDNKTYINSEEITSWPFEIIGTTRSIDEEIKLDYQFYYVLGDNRDNAYDSRTFGKVSKSQIIGVVINK